MKMTNILALLIALAAIAAVPPAEAFHNDPTFDCYGCHSKEPGMNPYNLIGADQGSTCLRCHQRNGTADAGDHYVSTPDTGLGSGLPPLELTPAGDFAWLKKDYFWKGEDGNSEYSIGEEHGHNIVAADYNYMISSEHPVAPGGKYPSAALACSSCHDPHGTYRRNLDGSITADGLPIKASGSYSDSPDPDATNSVSVYRMLAGINYQPKSLAESIPFKNNPPAAVAPRNYNRAETNTQTRVAYGSGMSEWCTNCHSGYNIKNSHPAGNNVKLTTAAVNAYNNYLPGENPMKSYLTLTPLEMGSADYAVLKATATTNDSQLKGPAGANVSCLTCHRAHASAWAHALRFNDRTKYTTIDDGNGTAAYPDPMKHPEYAQGRTAAETRKAYYDRNPATFGPRRGALCSKCHAKE